MSGSTEAAPSMVGNIRPVQAADAAGLAAIYNHYVLDTTCTFEERVVDAAEMASRHRTACSLNLPWLLLEREGRTIGFACANQWKGRSAYRHSVESTIYLAPEAVGQGLGRPLYERLLQALGDRNLHAVLAGIALPNPASVRLHERLGFEKVGHFNEIGLKFGRWVDVGYWQRIL